MSSGTRGLTPPMPVFVALGFMTDFMAISVINRIGAVLYLSHTDSPQPFTIASPEIGPMSVVPAVLSGIVGSLLRNSSVPVDVTLQQGMAHKGISGNLGLTLHLGVLQSLAIGTQSSARLAWRHSSGS